ncbi:MAG TPA: TRAP transporter substrate-binding protein [Candidatus Sulfotelmatobacter sp.]|nr:TRAP transporter substrate-binding protein [Candidatus Sulfotelmatobacter sp.]
MKCWGRSGLLVLVVLACLTAPNAWGQTFTLKVGIVHPPEHSFVVASQKFKELAEARSAGRLKVELFPSAQLGGEREMQEMVALGTLQMSVTGVIVTYEPLFALLEAPYLYRDREHIKKVMESRVVDDLGEALLKKGVRLVGFYENGFRHITNNVHAIGGPADVKGLKIRTPENLAQVETFKSLGAVATPIAYSELYVALKTGVVDGQENPLQNIWFGKFYEVQKHLALTSHIYNCAYVIANAKFWGGLPADLRGIAEGALREATHFQMDLVAKQDEKILADLKAKGMQVTSPSQGAFRQATAPTYDAFYAKFGDRARKIIEGIRGL